ncbi:MAG: substrate-binding domain-containing protein [Kiritimatiellae bacterium]|nr:substrate-binding domain-containing protein [Kiritimatiellia bacterium]
MKAPKIAILVDTSTGWGRRIVQGILDYTTEHGPWDVWIEPKGQNEEFNIPDDSDIKGVIARVSTQKLANEINACGIPAVNVSGLVLEGSDFPRVTIDWNAAAKLAEEHFRNRALRNFAYAGPLHLSYVHEHERAFEKALAESGTPCHLLQPDNNLSHLEQWPSRHKHLIPWLQSLPKPIGIYTWGFQIGRDIIGACRGANISIPHDVAVLGGDDDALLSNACHPALSGIVTPARQIGYHSTRILHSMIKGEPAPSQPLFIKPEEIEERLSTEMLAIENPQMVQALTYLRDNACKPIQVEDILKQVPMARRSLERNFVQCLGRNPAQEIRRLRINHARKLLAKTNLSMQEIAEACGYSSYNYLSHIFKKETGFPPGHYRSHTRANR